MVSFNFFPTSEERVLKHLKQVPIVGGRTGLGSGGGQRPPHRGKFCSSGEGASSVVDPDPDPKSIRIQDLCGSGS